MKLKHILPAAAALCFIAALASANTTSYWTQAGVPYFYKGKFSGTALTDSGRIILGTKIDKLFSPTEPYLWSAAYDSKGFLWAGSGHKAILYRIGNEPAILLSKR